MKGYELRAEGETSVMVVGLPLCKKDSGPPLSALASVGPFRGLKGDALLDAAKAWAPTVGLVVKSQAKASSSTKRKPTTPPPAAAGGGGVTDG